jgi:phage major head subunit gpT-like protein
MTTNEFDTPTGRYTVQSYGNGWAYTVTCNRTGEHLFFQDHSAEQLQAETDNFENEIVINQYFECLIG